MSKAAPTIELVTPEGVELEFPVASVPARIAAFSIDMGITLFVSSMIVLFGSFFGLTAAGGAGWAIVLLGVFFLRHGYFIWFESTWNGLTPGKRALGIRVVPRDGGVLDLEAVVARNILRDIELLLPLVALLAPETIVGSSSGWLNWIALSWIVLFVAVPLLTRERLRAGDLVGGTVVIHVPNALLLPDEAGMAHGKISFSPKHLSVYGERELETLASVLRRADRGEMDAYDMAVIAQTIARKVRYRGPEPDQSPREFLRTFYRAQRAELERRLVMGKRKSDKRDGVS